MMKATLNKDGTVDVPMRAETDGVIGDAIVTLKPGDDGYEAALKEAKED